jgi:hypothetical protein
MHVTGGGQNPAAQIAETVPIPRKRDGGMGVNVVWLFQIGNPRVSTS